MTWKLYALTSGGAVLVAALGAIVAPAERRGQNLPITVPQAVDRSGAAVDLGVQADRLKTKLAQVPAYHEPARDAFHFALAPRPVADPAPPTLDQAPPAVIAPPKPPYALAGMATSNEDGVPKRTAIISSLRGVSLVKEGDVLDGSYRVSSIADEDVTLESTTDGTQTTLHLSNPDAR